MTDPQPREGYWPTAPMSAPMSAPTSAPTEGATVQHGPMTRRGRSRPYGVAAGTAFAIVTTWATITHGVVLSWGLGVLAAGVLASAVALAIPRLRPFAQGFLAASVVVGLGSVALLYLFMATLFVAAVGP